MTPHGLKEYNKKNMTLSMPDLSALNNNLPCQLHFSYGCQMVCMNYANDDSNMAFYSNMFNEARTAFVLKPDNLRYTVVTTRCTNPSKSRSILQTRNTLIYQCIKVTFNFFPTLY